MKRPLPIDLLLLLVLIPAQIALFSFGDYFLIILLLLYLALTVWQPLSDLEALPERFGAARLVFLLRLLLLFLMLLIVPLAVSARNIQLRLQADAGQGEALDAYLLAFVLVILLLPLTVSRPTYKLALIIGVGLNPWLAQTGGVGHE